VPVCSTSIVAPGCSGATNQVREREAEDCELIGPTVDEPPDRSNSSARNALTVRGHAVGSSQRALTRERGCVDYAALSRSTQIGVRRKRRSGDSTESTA
jgi:hypothetical protein